MRLLTFALAALLVAVQAELWLGKSGVPRVVELQGRLAEQEAANAAAARRNRQLGAEVRDLKEGLEMVEEKARSELGMVKPDEILVQVAPKR
jgi:cell division protein FtsB